MGAELEEVLRSQSNDREDFGHPSIHACLYDKKLYTVTSSLLQFVTIPAQTKET